MPPSIVIVDYGLANLRSVQKALERVGHNAVIAGEPEQAARCDKLILPGVGAFQDGIAQLRKSGMADVVMEHIGAGKPLLGICLGLQFLFTRSHEDGLHAGLNVFPGEVVRFKSSPVLKVPHMGWNGLRFYRDCPLFRGLKDGDAVYFVHSYYAVPEDRGLIAATADYPEPFAASVWRDNIYATQFHPEKSQQVGLRMLQNFAEL